MEDVRGENIEILAGDGDLEGLKSLFELGYTTFEINVALGVAIAYSQIKVAEYLLSLGADISHYDYDAVYYAVHNNELEGLKFSIAKGVDVNVNNGQLLNTAVVVSMNVKNIVLLKWLIDNGADLQLLFPDMIRVAKKFGSTELKDFLFENNTNK